MGQTAKVTLRRSDVPGLGAPRGAGTRTPSNERNVCPSLRGVGIRLWRQGRPWADGKGPRAACAALAGDGFPPLLPERALADSAVSAAPRTCRHEPFIQPAPREAPCL